MPAFESPARQPAPKPEGESDERKSVLPVGELDPALHGNAAMQDQLRAADPLGGGPAGRTGAGAASPPADPVGALGGRAGPAAVEPVADEIRRSHPHGLAVSFAVAHTFGGDAEVARTGALPAEQRAGAARFIDATGWSALFRSRWAPDHVREMDGYSESRYSGTRPGTKERGLVLSAVWAEHRAEIKQAMIASDRTWAGLATYTEGQDDHFTREAQAFANRHAAVKIDGGAVRLQQVMTFEGPADITRQVNEVYRVVGARLGDPDAAKIRNVVIFTHGTRSGLMGAQRAVGPVDHGRRRPGRGDWWCVDERRARRAVRVRHR